METTEHKRPHEVIIPEIDDSKPLDLFQGAALKLELDKVEAEISSLVLDPTDPADHKQYGSINRKLGSFGAKVDRMGKELVDPMNKEIKVINSQRKAAKDRLADIRRAFMEPRELYDEEVAEHARRVNDAFELMHHGHQHVGEFSKATEQEWEVLIANIEAIDCTPELFTDRLEEAKALKAESLEMNRARFAKWQEDEAALEAGREALKIKQDAEAAARHEERMKAKAEAETKAKANETSPAAKPLSKATEPTTDPKAVVNRLILHTLVGKCNVTEEQGKAIVTAISRGEIPHTQIQY